MNDNSLYAQLAATSLQIVNWAHGNHLMVIISTLQLTIRLIFCISVSPCRPGSGSDCCRSPLTIMILNVCRYVGCMKISWKCFEGRPLRGFYQMPSKYLFQTFAKYNFLKLKYLDNGQSLLSVLFY